MWNIELTFLFVTVEILRERLVVNSFVSPFLEPWRPSKFSITGPLLFYVLAPVYFYRHNISTIDPSTSRKNRPPSKPLLESISGSRSRGAAWEPRKELKDAFCCIRRGNLKCSNIFFLSCVVPVLKHLLLQTVTTSYSLL